MTTTCPNGHWIDWSDAQTGACSACLFEETGGQRRSDEEFNAVYGDGPRSRGPVLMAWDEKNLRVLTLLDDRAVVADTELVAMVSLRIGDRFLGLDAGQQVFEVTGPPSWVPALRDPRQHRGWMWVRNLSLSDAQVRAAIRRREAEPGTDPRDGGFPPSFLPGTRVKKVLRLIAGR